MILLWMVKQKSEKNSRIECVCLQSSWSGQNHDNYAGFSRIIRLLAEPYWLGRVRLIARLCLGDFHSKQHGIEERDHD